MSEINTVAVGGSDSLSIDKKRLCLIAYRERKCDTCYLIYKLFLTTYFQTKKKVCPRKYA